MESAPDHMSFPYCALNERRDKSAAETDLITGAEYVDLIKLISYQTPGGDFWSES